VERETERERSIGRSTTSRMDYEKRSSVSWRARSTRGSQRRYIALIAEQSKNKIERMKYRQVFDILNSLHHLL